MGLQWQLRGNNLKRVTKGKKVVKIFTMKITMILMTMVVRMMTMLMILTMWRNVDDINKDDCDEKGDKT